MASFTRFSRFVTVAVLAAAPLQAQDSPPMVPYQSLLAIGFFNIGEEVRTATNTVDLAFAPSGNFSAKVVYLRGTRVLRELPATVTQRAGTMARLTFRGINVGFGKEEGECAIEVHVNGQVAGRLRLTLKKVSTGDAFSPTVTWLVDGPWRNHAQFIYTMDATRQQRVNVAYWASNTEITGGPKGMLELVVRRGSTVLLRGRPREVSAPNFLRKEDDLRTADGQVLVVPELARLNGPITIEVKQGNRVVKSFTGEIRGGQFVPHAHSALTGVDPAHFLSPRTITEGGSMVSDLMYSWMTAQP